MESRTLSLLEFPKVLDRLAGYAASEPAAAACRVLSPMGDAARLATEQRKLAEAYLNFLYTPEAQAIIFKNFYRGWDTSKAAPEDVARFPKLDLATIADFGGWAKAQKDHFADGGIFDQIYTAQ